LIAKHFIDMRVDCVQQHSAIATMQRRSRIAFRYRKIGALYSASALRLLIVMFIAPLSFADALDTPATADTLKPPAATAETVVWSSDPTVVDPALIEAIARLANSSAESASNADAPAPLPPEGSKDLAMSPGATFAAPKSLQSFALQSRELVDVEFVANGALSILISAPAAAAPGLYHWAATAHQPKKICDITAPSFFSFDRRVVIERINSAPSRIRTYRPHDCSRIADFEVTGRVLDIDARGDRIAAAVRLSATQIELQLFDTNGALLATAPIGRNVEMGFSPDGRMILNFDLSDAGARAWSVPKLIDVSLPRWLSDTEVTFVPGSNFVKRYEAGTLTISRWPIGTTLHSVKANRALRLRQLSANGHIGILHEYLRGADRLDWIDFTTGLKTPLAAGSIDNAALSPDLGWAAWTVRKGTTSEVWVQRAAAPIPSPAALRAQPQLSVTKQAR
jgi:hypothetical protein